MVVLASSPLELWKSVVFTVLMESSMRMTTTCTAHGAVVRQVDAGLEGLPSERLRQRHWQQQPRCFLTLATCPTSRACRIQALRRPILKLAKGKRCDVRIEPDVKRNRVVANCFEEGESRAMRGLKGRHRREEHRKDRKYVSP